MCLKTFHNENSMLLIKPNMFNIIKSSVIIIIFKSKFTYSNFWIPQIFGDGNACFLKSHSESYINMEKDIFETSMKSHFYTSDV